MTNAFEAFAEATKPRHQARREAAADRRAANLRRQKEEAQLRKLANAAGRRRMDEILAGPHGDAMRELKRFLRGMTIADAPRLIAFVEGSPLRTADATTRFAAFEMVDAKIVRLRIGEGLPEFDDGLDDEPPRAMQVCKTILEVL